MLHGIFQKSMEIDVPPHLSFKDDARTGVQLWKMRPLVRILLFSEKYTPEGFAIHRNMYETMPLYGGLTKRSPTRFLSGDDFKAGIKETLIDIVVPGGMNSYIWAVVLENHHKDTFLASFNAESPLENNLDLWRNLLLSLRPFGHAPAVAEAPERHEKNTVGLPLFSSWGKGMPGYAPDDSRADIPVGYDDKVDSQKAKKEIKRFQQHESAMAEEVAAHIYRALHEDESSSMAVYRPFLKLLGITIASAADVMNYCRIYAIEVKPGRAKGGIRLFLHMETAWDAEHGLCVCFENRKITGLFLDVDCPE